MRYLYDDEEIEGLRATAWDAGFGLGAAIGVGLTLAACGLWALLVGVWT